jgi:hypothetical protein
MRCYAASAAQRPREGAHARKREPHSYYLELEILRGLGLSAQMKSAFEHAIGKYPTYYPL